METLHLSHFADYLKPRPAYFHKGQAGKVLVIGGDHGYSGAVLLAGMATLRVGAGLVKIATQASHARHLNVAFPELMCVEAQSGLEHLIADADVVALGPGLGQSAWSQDIFRSAIKADKPMIVDADGLNLLAQNPQKKDHWILTPHAGEAGRLLKTTAAKIQADRQKSALQIAQQYGGICVLKGSGTLIATATEVMKCGAGNPGMATAGMGDVLTGVITGLVAQGIPLTIAAQLGVLVHAQAGDEASTAGQRGMIASDLFPYIRQTVNWD